MLDQAQLTTIRNYLEQAKTITLVCGVQPSIDVLSAVSVLNQALSEVGKEVRLVAQSALPTQVISGLETVATTLGKQNLVVSFPYDESAVDKVSYHIGEESGQFHLTIKPKKGAAPLDSSLVEFSYAGTESDLLILVGVTQFEELEQVYFGYEDFFEKTPKLAFSKNMSQLGNSNISSNGYSSISECLLVLLNSLGIPFSVESATNILSAIDVETDYMRSLTATATTFEAAAQLMRMGARRVRPEQTGAPANAEPARENKKTEITVKRSSPQPQKQSQKPFQKNQQTQQNQNNQQSTSKSLKRKQSIPLKSHRQIAQNTSSQPGGLQYDPSNGESSRS